MARRIIAARFFWSKVLIFTLFFAGSSMVWFGLPQPQLLAASDVVVDAKRKAAAQLFKDGKYSDAITLYTEVIATDSVSYTDHLQLARAHDKLSHAAESVAEYKKVLEMIPAAPTNADERAARAEAERKAKVVPVKDTVSAKIDSTVDEYLKKLDVLEREAIGARNMNAMMKIFRLKGSTWNATGAKDRGYLEVNASTGWQKTTVEVRQGQVYHVRAAGTWMVYAANASAAEMTANGNGKKSSAGIVLGSLAGNVINQKFQLGEDATFTAPATGTLELMEEENNHQDRIRNKGSIAVLIWQ